MTICVAVQVNDCLVFAADSAVTLTYGSDPNGQEIINVFPHGNKVFNLHRDLPICAMTCGLGNLGPESTAILAKDLRIKLMGGDASYALDPSNYTIEEVAEKTRKFLFDEKFSQLPVKPQTHLNFYIGGYSSGADAPERWLVRIESEKNHSPAPERLGAPGEGGLSWGGQPEAINRLVMGISGNYAEALAAENIDPAVGAPIITAVQNHCQVYLVSAAMPVQDAINLADFLVETTKRFVRFLPGADIVGGETDIAVVTKHEGFKWIKRKHFFSSHLNPSEVSYGTRYPVEKGKPGHSGGAS
ncbi:MULTISPECIES: hypothetical protein [unclassified Bradyrhizobium]|uniref:hypothetical protein n=1 Tax=unclassified Bradyrhizobium TaxID=2631580 RepID=UPI0029168EAC|nr:MULTISPECIES: hypothetical protein [unclassified Bradyrhizobium]